MPSAHRQSLQSYSPLLNGQIGCPHLATIDVHHISSSPQTFRGELPSALEILCLEVLLQASPHSANLSPWLAVNVRLRQ